MGRTNEKKTTVHEFDDVTVKVKYFWAGEDKLIPFDTEVTLPNAWIHAKARIDLLEFTENFEGLGMSKDFKVLQLYVNDEFVGELFSIQDRETDLGLMLEAEVVVGAG